VDRRLRVRGAVQSLVDKDTGQELVDTNAAWALGQCVYETLPTGRDFKREAFRRTSVRNVKVQPGARGPVWHSLVVTADLDGCATNQGVKAEVRLYDTEKRVGFHFALRKLPVRSAEAVYVAFPFRAPDSEMLYEAQGGLVTPGKNQLPGSASDWQTLQNFIAVRRADSQIVLGSSPRACCRGAPHGPRPCRWCSRSSAWRRPTCWSSRRDPCGAAAA